MVKKTFGKVISMLLIVCILLSTLATTAFAATTYYIDVTLSGPDANGVTKTVSGQSSKYGALSSPLTYEVVQVINANLKTIQTVYAQTGLSQMVYDSLKAFNDGEDAWKAYGDLHIDDVSGDFKKTLRSLDSTFADLTINEVNKISYRSEKGDVYVVTVTLRKNCTGDETCSATHLTDLDADEWYYDGIHYCVENGLMQGYPDNLFGPNDTLTRAQVAQVLYNLENKPNVKVKAIFDDVHSSAWYANAITWANEAGIILGYGNGKCGPDEAITREQLAAMLSRYSEYKGYDVSAGDKVDSLIFSDANDISDWALSAIKWAYATGIIQGFENGILNPTSSATRGQAATMFMRYCVNATK